MLIDKKRPYKRTLCNATSKLKSGNSVQFTLNLKKETAGNASPINYILALPNRSIAESIVITSFQVLSNAQSATSRCLFLQTLDAMNSPVDIPIPLFVSENEESSTSAVHVNVQPGHKIIIYLSIGDSTEVPELLVSGNINFGVGQNTEDRREKVLDWMAKHSHKGCNKRRTKYARDENCGSDNEDVPTLIYTFVPGGDEVS